ncbi:MAG TPA: YlxR family protein [Clostridiales bacterium]|nr:YlxR family protein [Clostridiales bacterium]
MRPKKLPMRMCTGCGEHKPKRELVRVVRTKEGDIFLDLTGRASGRGAYICKNSECFRLAVKSKRIEKTLKAKVPEDVYASIEEELKNNG